MNYQQVKNLKDLQLGDIIRGKSTHNVFVVTAHYGSRVTAVASQDITNSSEWEVLRPSTETMNKEWISVEDRLPEDDQDVIILCKPIPAQYPNGIQIGHTSYLYLENRIWILNDGTETEFVTHWMPLPEPPNQA